MVGNMSMSGGMNAPFDRAKYREKLWTISDAELIQEGKWIRETCRQHTLPWDVMWDEKLADCKAEWRRRHPK